MVKFNYLIDASALLGFNAFEGGVAAPMLIRGKEIAVCVANFPVVLSSDA